MDGQVMKWLPVNRILIIISALILLASCHRVVIRVDDIPSNTPKGQPLYVAGNFNNWDPGDEAYQMILNPDSSYTYQLPPGFGQVEFKITRGDWTRVETDICGYEIENRTLALGEEDTASISIASWNDLDPLNCPRLTLVLKDIPENTPPNEPISLAGNFNSWNPDESAVLRKDSLGKYSITIPRPPKAKDLEFKITRGDLSKSESDEFGNVRPNRSASFGKKDTIELSIEGWVDMPVSDNNNVQIICTKIPAKTPPDDDILLVSNLNNWDPYDRKFVMRKTGKGQYTFSLPKRNYTLEFKFTRGGWHTVETDPYGFDISNREADLSNEDTIFVEIEGWKDLPSSFDKDVTIILSELPPQTPAEDKLYLAGNFNGWDPNKLRFRFEKMIDGRYILNIPRENHSMEFKVTRGSWKTIEVNPDGSEIANRNYLYKDYDTLYIRVANWKDIPPFRNERTTIVIDELPANTPPSSQIFIAGTFNDWNPGNKSMTLKKLINGKFYITLSLKDDYIEYKITRGGWHNCEVDENGWEIPNRGLSLGFADTVHISIARWRDK
jgi:hypothetical protein